MSVIDNKYRSVQLKGNNIFSHNVLSKETFATLFKSTSLSKLTIESFKFWIAFIVGILTAMIPMALESFTLSQISKLNLNNKWDYKITSALGIRFGPSKTIWRGFRVIGEKTVKICIGDEAYIHGAVIVF